MSIEADKVTLPSDQELLEKYGITRVPTDVFHYRQYRYSNLKDAIAQAERDKLVSV